MNLDGIILNEISHREEDNYCMVHTCGLRRKTKKSNSQKQSRMVDARGWKVGKKEEAGTRLQAFSYKMSKS